ncbi:MAG: CBS domain-containing protein [Bacteroidia bacterium]|nr:CBS domain-containing protein [Bacteroidia bacterium]
MGNLNVKIVRSQQEQQQFVRYLLKDLHALERMLREDWFESDVSRIGAEQEMCLVDNSLKPYSINLKALEMINDPAFTTELASFNLETNLTPLEFKGTCISDMHLELKRILDSAQDKLRDMGAIILLSGILPTIRKSDVDISNITPVPRYRALMDGLRELRGEAFELRITGMDELNLKQESAMLEACNTSFQVHLQVSPDDFVRKYNYAQALAGPAMSVAVNSPLLFGRRLWKETRIALFEQSIDIRTFTDHLRDRSPRVTFGNDWLRRSIIEIYREDVARFKVLLTSEVDEDVIEKLNSGQTPRLRALNMHNSTVYRWNRPCYGISDNGKPHLRIENRIFPAGPSLPDAFANAAFWLGMMNGMEDQYPDITQVLDFADVKANFFNAARFGLETQLTWTRDRKISPAQLILEELLPVSRHGLEKAGIRKQDIDYYLGIIEERTRTGKTGAKWMLTSFATIARDGVPRDEVIAAITASMHTQQHAGKPVHEWELACRDKMDYEPSALLVEEFMSTDLITVQEDDILDLPATLMEWRKIRHVAVEDKQGKLVGLITSRMLLRHLAANADRGPDEVQTVADVMKRNPHFVTPEDTIIKAIEIMRTRQIGCLPVQKNDKLVGMITEAEFLNITSNLIKRLARKKEEEKMDLSAEKHDLQRKPEPVSSPQADPA